MSEQNATTDYSDPVYDPGESDPDPSAFSMDFYRNKAREFQKTLNAVDSTYVALIELVESDVSEELQNDVFQYLQEFENRKTEFKLTAEAINAGAAIINSMGGRFPTLSVPGTLGIVPIVLPVATIAAIGVAASLAYWGTIWIQGINERLKREQLIGAQNSDEAKAALARAISKSDQSVSESEGSIWSALGGSIKWVVLGVAGFVIWRYMESRK